LQELFLLFVMVIYTEQFLWRMPCKENYIPLPKGRAIAEAVSRWLSTSAAPVRTPVGQLGFLVDKVAAGQGFSEYFGFPYQKPVHSIKFSIFTITRGRHAETLRRADHPSKESCRLS
jgi:hypothetical protein